MREYKYKGYIKLVEKSSESVLQKFMQAEIEEILKVKTPQVKTFVDLGAGYGRVLHTLANIAKNVYSIDLNPNMLAELKRRTKQFDNAKVIVGDITELSRILKDKDLKNPVLLLLQNTIGTIEGEWEKVLFEMKKVAQERSGEIIISFLRSEVFSSYGISKLYPSISKMLDNPDFERIDFPKHIFVSKNGYSSKWRNNEEIEKIKQFFQGRLINEVWTNEFCILHIKYT
jgi:ubiquinone/menaquinone biosynthesis C-methylase UbiE